MIWNKLYVKNKAFARYVKFNSCFFLVIFLRIPFIFQIKSKRHTQIRSILYLKKAENKNVIKEVYFIFILLIYIHLIRTRVRLIVNKIVSEWIKNLTIILITILIIILLFFMYFFELSELFNAIKLTLKLIPNCLIFKQFIKR